MTISLRDLMQGKIDLGSVTSRRAPKAVAPGTILRDLFLKPLGLTAYRLAKGTHLSPTAVSEILKGRRAITVDTATRLALFFSMSPEFWLGLQNHHDIIQRRNQKSDWKALTATIKPYASELMERFNTTAARGKPVKMTFDELDYITAAAE